MIVSQYSPSDRDDSVRVAPPTCVAGGIHASGVVPVAAWRTRSSTQRSQSGDRPDLPQGRWYPRLCEGELVEPGVHLYMWSKNGCPGGPTKARGWSSA